MGTHARPTDCPTQTAAEFGNADALVQLVEYGARVETVDAHGRTALIWAAIRAQPATVSALLHCGADPSARMNGGATALQMAEEVSSALISSEPPRPPPDAHSLPRNRATHNLSLTRP